MRIIFAVLFLLISGCTEISKSIDTGDENFGVTIPIYTFKNEYILSEKNDGWVTVATFPGNDAKVIEGTWEPIKLIRVNPEEVTIREIIPYDIERDVCRLRPSPDYNCSPNFVLHSSDISNIRGAPFEEVRRLDGTEVSLSAQNIGWGLKQIRAPKSWAENPNSHIVAVIDSGVDCNHPALTNVCVGGYNAITNREGIHEAFDDNGHGTHVAGIIAAHDLGNGVSGVCKDCKILSVKFMGASGSGSLYDAIKGIEWASHRSKILNNSWGGGGYSEPLRTAIRSAGNRGASFVAAAGNEGLNLDQIQSFPASYDEPNIISVASVNEDGALSLFSNYGKQSVDIAAPGAHIISTFPNAQYANLSGTSMAAPFVAGTIALLRGDKDFGDVRSILETSPRRFKNLSNKTIDSKRLDAYFIVRECNTIKVVTCRKSCVTPKCRDKCLKKNCKV